MSLNHFCICHEQRFSWLHCMQQPVSAAATAAVALSLSLFYFALFTTFSPSTWHDQATTGNYGIPSLLACNNIRFLAVCARSQLNVSKGFFSLIEASSFLQNSLPVCCFVVIPSWLLRCKDIEKESSARFYNQAIWNIDAYTLLKKLSIAYCIQYTTQHYITLQKAQICSRPYSNMYDLHFSRRHHHHGRPFFSHLHLPSSFPYATSF